MLQALLAIHLLTALIIIGLVLMQQGKGAEAGASFGAGASQTIFGSSGSWNFFSRMTAIFATIFFVTSIGLAVMAKNAAGVGDPNLPQMEETDIPRDTGESESPATDSEPSTREIPVLNESGSESAIPVAPGDAEASENPGAVEEIPDVPGSGRESE